ncbi:MAG: glycosyltransferase [Clostridiales bacterium]|nr:glycosyltransferase [Clostridiales bacterium]
MKILFVLDQYFDANNGMTNSARRFARGLSERGHEVRICAIGGPDQTPYGLREFRLPLVGWIIASEGMAFARPDREILRQALSWCDIAHLAVPFPLGRAAADLAGAMGVPFTAAFHVQPENITSTVGLGHFAPANDALYLAGYRYFYRYCRYLHCPSGFIAGELRKRGYDRTCRLYVISNGIDPFFMSAERREKPEELKDRFVILSSGRLSAEKRQDALIRAAALSRHSGVITLRLAGQGPRAGYLERLAAREKVDCGFGFYDQEGLKELISYSDLYVHAADAEIEAMSCMEAFAGGLVPVIANSKKSATPQFALDGRSRFRANDPVSLANRIDYWIEHPAERARMGRAYAASAGKYALSASVAAFERMLRDALSGR